MKFKADIALPSLIDDQRFDRNGMIPNAVHLKRLADGFNFVQARCKKQIFMKCQPLTSVEAGATLSYFWRYAFVMGEATTTLRVMGGFALSTSAATDTPALTFDVYTTGGALAKTVSVYANGRTGGGTTVTPVQIHHFTVLIEGLSPATEYRVRNSVAYGIRPIYLSVAEESSEYADNTYGVGCDPTGYVAEGPIYAAQTNDLITANNGLWRHNAAQLFVWVADMDEDSVGSPVISATTYTNAINLSSTSVTANTAGVHLFTMYHNTVNRTSIPVKAVAYCTRSTGTGTLDIRFTDGTNNVDISGVTGGGGQWVSATGTIPPQTAGKWDLHAKVSSGTWKLQSFSLFEYEP